MAIGDAINSQSGNGALGSAIDIKESNRACDFHNIEGSDRSIARFHKEDAKNTEERSDFSKATHETVGTRL